MFLQIFPLNEKIENINDQYWTLRAEEVSFVSWLSTFMNRIFNSYLPVRLCYTFQLNVSHLTLNLIDCVFLFDFVLEIIVDTKLILHKSILHTLLDCRYSVCV